MVKMNFTSNQTAFAYSIYMMLGSYFDKTKCLTPLQEKKMRVQYLEQKLTSQYQMEETCIRLIEKELLPKLPKEIWNNQMEVYLIGIPGTGRTEVQFHCPEYILRVVGSYGGKRNSKLIYEVWQKDAEPRF